jgi:hypothetical protein
MDKVLRLNKKLVPAIIAFLLLLLPTPIFAAVYSITPPSGYVAAGDEFVLDILIDTEGAKSNLARAVVTFDPTLVKLTKAERNNSLYATYPEDGQSTDNTNGVVMITGFTQSGSGSLYQTDGSPDVFARLTFEVLKKGTLEIEWEFSGQDEPFKSVIMIDGSPPQNGLSSKPSGARYILEDGTPDVPVTALSIEKNNFVIAGVAIIGAGLIFSGGGVLYGVSRKYLTSNKRTLVEYD